MNTRRKDMVAVSYTWGAVPVTSNSVRAVLVPVAARRNNCLMSNAEQENKLKEKHMNGRNEWSTNRDERNNKGLALLYNHPPTEFHLDERVSQV